MKSPSFKSPEAEEPEGPSSTPLGVQILSFLCGLLVAFLGFKSAWQDWRNVDKLTHLDSFVETDGKFLKVDVRRDSSGSGEWYPDVLYEYKVPDSLVWGWRLSYEDEPKGQDYWKGRLAGYAQGQSVKIYYNPAQPKDSIVEKKRDSLYRVIMKMALGIAFFAAGMLLAVLPAMSWLRRAPPGQAEPN